MKAGWWCGVVLQGVLLLGCGARTDLARPDGGADAAIEPDAAADAGPDADAEPEPEVLCIEAPRDAGPVRASLTVPVSLAVVDVLFLLDATGSMADEIGTIRRRLRGRVVPGVRAVIPEAQFGVAYVGEFPVRPHGPGDVSPYELRAPITPDLVRIEGALESAPRWGNFDEPEAQVEGMYQVATGAGLAEWIPPSSGCPAGGSGGACFRDDALPVILLATDAPFHNGPPDVPPISSYDFVPPPHDYDDAVSALRKLGALVLGLGARDLGSRSPMSHLRAIARDTGAVDESGEPLAFDIGRTGGGIGRDVIRAIERLAGEVLLEVDAVVRDGPGDDIDARMLVERVVPLSADPPDGVEAIGEDRFVGVRPGTRVTFELEVDGSALPPGDSTRRIPASILFRAFGRSRLGRQDVVIVVPGEDGGGCAGADTVPGG